MTDLLTAVRSFTSPDALQAFLDTLPADDLALVEQALGRTGDGWRAHPAALAEFLTAREPEPMRRWRYVDLLSERFAAAVNGTSTRQIWNVPARYGKSTIASRWGPIWCFDQHPAARIILSSYGDELAREHATFVRDRMEQHADLLGTSLRRDRRRNDRFVTLHGGGLLAKGINSSITGFGAGGGGGIIVDDPFKNWQAAHSAGVRAKVYDEFRGTLRLRLDSDDAWIIVVHTRWHEEDLTGMLLAEAEDETGEKWELIRLPAIAEAHNPKAANRIDRTPDPLGREPGEPLEPERFTLAAVQSRARDLGSYLAAGLEQQRPAPAEGTELLRDWFRLEATVPPKADEAITSWDLKLKDREAGDYVVGQCWWRAGAGYWLMDQVRGGFDHATTVNAIALLAVRHPEARLHLVESAGSADEVIPRLRAPQAGYTVSDDVASRLGMTEDERTAVAALRRRGLSGIVPVPARGSKDVRARAHIAPLAEAGDVHFPAEAPWVPALLDEVAAFPNGAHDDQVDAMSQALARLHRLGASVSGPPAASLPGRGRGGASAAPPRRLGGRSTNLRGR